MKSLLKLIRSIWLVALLVVSVLPMVASALSPVSALVSYDGQKQTRSAYDGALLSSFNYDSPSVPLAGGEEYRTVRTVGLFPSFAQFLAAEGTGTAARFIVSDSGQVLDTSAITIPGPVNSTFGKIDYLLGNVTLGDNAALSAGKGGFFSGVMGYDQTTLGSALQNQLIDNFGSATINGNRISVVGPMTGPSGTTANVLSAWQVTPSGSVSFITAFPK